jgi:hypothetical protein
MAVHFVRGYTSSLPVIPASRSAPPASEKEKQIHDTFGRISNGSSDVLNRRIASLRTFLATLILGSKPYTRTWSDLVTLLKRDCLRRQKSAPRTDESDCSSWPTIQIADSKQCKFNKRGNPHLGTVVWATPEAQNQEGYQIVNGKKVPRLAQQAQWPTPTAIDPKGQDQPNRQGGMSLAHITQMPGQPAPAVPSTNGKSQESWTTPSTDDINNRTGKYNQGGTALNTQAKNWRTPSSDGEGGQMEIRSGCNARLKLRDQTKGKLNPDWVEQLMGLPVGWTDLDS